MTLFLKILFKNSYLFLNNKNYREFLRLVLFYADKQRYQARTIHFLNYKFKVPDCLSFVWQFKEIFVDEYYFFETASSEPVIYDCGANIGTSCVYFKKHYPKAKIIAIEADPTIAEILKSNLIENKINDIEIINKAVWIHNDGIDLSPEGSDGASIFGTGDKIKVPSLRLQQLLQNQPIDMLKMDIEGAETEVLKDCRNELRNIKNMFIEYHSYSNQQQQLNELLSILTENQFKYTIISPYVKPRPLVNKKLRQMHGMDLQLNIFAFRNS